MMFLVMVFGAAHGLIFIPVFLTFFFEGLFEYPLTNQRPIIKFLIVTLQSDNRALLEIVNKLKTKACFLGLEIPFKLLLKLSWKNQLGLH